MSTIRAGAIAHFDAVARSAGLESRSLLRSAGLDASPLDDLEHRISAVAVAALLEEASVRSGRSDFGLMMARDWSLSDLGPVSLAIVCQDDLRGALQALIRYRLRVSDAISWEIVEAGEQARVTFTLSLPPETQCRQLVEFMAGKLINLCRTVAGQDWTPIGATFRHPSLLDAAAHASIFGVTPDFAAEADGLILRRSDLDLMGPRGMDPAFRRHAEALVEFLPHAVPETMSEKAARLIRSHLPSGSANLNTVAEALGLNPRTLQRRLQAEGQGFSDLLDSVRRDLAERYLLDRSMPVSRIAELLGYADGSALTRWFTEQFLVPPSRWRDLMSTEQAVNLASGSPVHSASQDLGACSTAA